MAGKNKTSNEKSSKTGGKNPKAVKTKSNNNEGDENSSSSKLKPATAINSRHILVRNSLSLVIIYIFIYFFFAPEQSARADLESKITLLSSARNIQKKKKL